MCDSHKITYHFYSIALIPSIEVLLGLQKLQYKDPQEQLTMVIMWRWTKEGISLVDHLCTNCSNKWGGNKVKPATGKNTEDNTLQKILPERQRR